MNWFHNHHLARKVQYQLSEVDQVLAILHYSMIPRGKFDHSSIGCRSLLAMTSLVDIVLADWSIGEVVVYINTLNRLQIFISKTTKRNELLDWSVDDDDGLLLFAVAANSTFNFRPFSIVPCVSRRARWASSACTKRTKAYDSWNFAHSSISPYGEKNRQRSRCVIRAAILPTNNLWSSIVLLDNINSYCCGKKKSKIISIQ